MVDPRLTFRGRGMTREAYSLNGTGWVIKFSHSMSTVDNHKEVEMFEKQNPISLPAHRLRGDSSVILQKEAIYTLSALIRRCKSEQEWKEVCNALISIWVVICSSIDYCVVSDVHSENWGYFMDPANNLSFLEKEGPARLGGRPWLCFAATLLYRSELWWRSRQHVGLAIHPRNRQG